MHPWTANCPCICRAESRRPGRMQPQCPGPVPCPASSGATLPASGFARPLIFKPCLGVPGGGRDRRHMGGASTVRHRHATRRSPVAVAPVGLLVGAAGGQLQKPIRSNGMAWSPSVAPAFRGGCSVLEGPSGGAAGELLWLLDQRECPTGADPKDRALGDIRRLHLVFGGVCSARAFPAARQARPPPRRRPRRPLVAPRARCGRHSEGPRAGCRPCATASPC